MNQFCYRNGMLFCLTLQIMLVILVNDLHLKIW